MLCFVPVTLIYVASAADWALKANYLSCFVPESALQRHDLLLLGTVHENKDWVKKYIRAALALVLLSVL